MSPVTLRCPTCGTTQARPGECEACSEDEVRWFCANHQPGLWLAGPACEQCGAEVGKAPRRPSPSARPASAPPRESRMPEARRASPRRPEPSRDPPLEPEVVEPDVVVPSLPEILETILGARRRRGGAGDGPEWRPGPELRLPTLPIRGCLVKLMWLAVLFVTLGFFAAFMLVSGMMQVVGPVGRF